MGTLALLASRTAGVAHQILRVLFAKEDTLQKRTLAKPVRKAA